MMNHIIFILYLLNISLVSCDWIDPDTSKDNHTIISHVDKKPYKLIFSDEFNVNNRKFNDGHDPRWTAIHKNDYTNFALHYYHHDLVHTNDGYLNISTIMQDISYPVQSNKNGKSKTTFEMKHYRSAMIQGWNKFCFTGGIIKIRAKLPGDAYIGGFWPAIWLLGNLARATYVSSSNNVWPWSYNKCNKKIQAQQLFSACNVINHFNLNRYQGRGAPEIDIFEVMPGYEELINTNTMRPYMSTSLQVAPAILDYRPVPTLEPDYSQWYNHGIEYGLNSTLNIFFYGMYLQGIYEERSYLADALSANTNIEPTHFDDFHDYRIEWKAGDDGYIRWYLDDVFRYGIHADALNKTGAQIPAEPMYLIINNAISSQWGFPMPCPAGCACDCYDARREECQCAVPPRMHENFPAFFLIDYVRVYQDDEDEAMTIGCSSKQYPTRRYIDAHPHAYSEATGSSRQVTPLQAIKHGGKHCNGGTSASIYQLSSNIGDLECGHGSCNHHHTCSCDNGYTGPDCKAYIAYDDVNLDPDYDILSLSSFIIPSSLIILSIILMVVSCLVIVYKYHHNRAVRGTWRMIARPVYSMDSLARATINLLSTSSSSSARRRDQYEAIVEMESYHHNSICIDDINPMILHSHDEHHRNPDHDQHDDGDHHDVDDDDVSKSYQASA